MTIVLCLQQPLRKLAEQQLQPAILKALEPLQELLLDTL